jgi:hypothetical protein
MAAGELDRSEEEGRLDVNVDEVFRFVLFLDRVMLSVFLRLPALMDLYIHPLYVLVSKILSSILNSSALIHPLYHPLSTLSTMGPTCHFI